MLEKNNKDMSYMKNQLKTVLVTAALGAIAQTGHAGEELNWNEPNAANPILPGYFADPTIRKFGDTYYIYATTDGNGGGFGPSQVWGSKDLNDWTIMPMNWPTTHWIWAPDVFKQGDKYYFLYCQPCTLHMGESETPRGPWINVLGETDAVLVPDRFVHNAITLDGQHFRDDDGSIYFYFGTWGIYKGFGCGVAKLNDDMKSFSDKKLIENTEITDFFEAPYVFKKDGVYYFTYSSGSCHDHTYRVQYATSTEGPMGPFTYKGCILESNEDRTVDGPGHHSILEENGKYYILYHRHDNPHSTRGMHRQLCIDELKFGTDGSILKVDPTHTGVNFNKTTSAYPDLAFGKPVIASSYYNNSFHPQYAVDNNNATLWRPQTVNPEWLQIDLEAVKHVEQIETQWEYGTAYYCYTIETSTDGVSWTPLVDRSMNRLAGSPMVDYVNADFRYLRIHFRYQENNGMPGAIWNVKVYGGIKNLPPQQWVGVDANNYTCSSCNNDLGMLGGTFGVTDRDALRTTSEGGKKALLLPAGTTASTSVVLPGILKNKKKTIPEYTVSFQAYYNSAWHQLAQVYKNGKTTNYVDAAPVAALPKSISVAPGKPLQLSAGKSDLVFTDLRMYSWAQEPAEIAYDRAYAMEHKGATEYQQTATRAGELLTLDANDYQVGEQLTTLVNCAEGKETVGNLTARGTSLGVVLKEGEQAFEFTGLQQFVSEKGLPTTMLGNAPYTISAWVYNPQVEANECILNLVPTQEENATVSFGNGSSESNGIVSHCGSFEDRGDKSVKANQGKWSFWTVTFDGYMESIYLNGNRIAKKDIVMLLQPSPYVTLGNRDAGDWPFSGYVRRITLYDTALTPEQVMQESKKAQKTDVLFLFNAATDTPNYTKNEGEWGGSCNGTVAETLCQNRLSTASTISVNRMKGSNAEQISLGFVTDKSKLTHPLLSISTFLQVSLNKGVVTVNNVACPIDEALAAGFHEIVLKREGTATAVWIDGKRSSVTSLAWPSFADATQLQLLPGGGQKVGITSCVIRSASSDDSSIAAQYQQQTAAITVTPEFQARAVTPALLSLSATISASTPLLYRYTAGSTQTDWIQDSEYLLPVTSSTKTARIEVRDVSGRMVGSKEYSVKSLLSQKSFTVTSIADGLSAFTGTTLRKDDETPMNIDITDGVLTLSSAGCNFAVDGVQNGPFIYKELTGDFVVQAHVKDFIGRSDRTTPAYNEGGVMVLVSTPQNRGKAQTGLHVGVFPHYNQGNIFTHLNHGRMQSSNNKGWDFDPWMQIERKGDTFYVRTSADGVTWTEVPGAPVSRPDLHDATLKVGFYQVTYTEASGNMQFDNAEIYIYK
jgi:beta-xylosidase